ncbi:unnamed protein product, partial [Dicrocoelium dendriticum]
MNTVLSITVVIVALLCAYSTQVRSSDSLSDDKHGTEARGDIRETESTQGKLDASVQFENTKPKIEVIEHVTEQLKESTITSGASKQESGYRLTFPTGRYQKWSNWSKCDPIECVESRRRECVDESWMQSDVNRSGARRCPSRYYEETRDCKNKTTCVTYGMLENCGVQTNKEDIAFDPNGAERTTPNSWPWLVRVITIDPEGKEEYFCSGTLISKKLIVIAAHCFIDNGLLVNTGLPTNAVLSKNRTLFAYLGNHRSSADHGTAEKYLIETMFVNTYYDSFKISKGHDMALLQLAKPAAL